VFKYLKKKKGKSLNLKRKSEKSSDLKDIKKTKPLNDLAYLYLKSPHITEKATFLSEGNQYVFKTKNDSNKVQIKKAIESLYGVDVLNVNIIKIPAKKKRIGRKIGSKKGYKKAIIKIKAGQKIEVH